MFSKYFSILDNLCYSKPAIKEWRIITQTDESNNFVQARVLISALGKKMSLPNIIDSQHPVRAQLLL